MPSAELLRLSRRMQWVRKNQQAISNTRIFSGEQSRLASAIRLAAEEHSSGRNLSHLLHRAAQALLIFLSAVAWRPARATLSKRKIAAQHVDTFSGKLLRQRDQQR